MSKYIYEATFKEYDKDGSGFIDKNELKALLEATFKKSGLTLSQESLDYHLQKFDSSNDGKISLDEFCDKMDKYNHPAEYNKTHWLIYDLGIYYHT